MSVDPAYDENRVPQRLVWYGSDSWGLLCGSAHDFVCFLYRLSGTDCSAAVQYVPPPQVYWDTTWISSPVSNHHLFPFKTTGKPFVRRFLVIRLIQRSGNFGFPTTFSSLTACDGRSSTKVWLTAHSTPVLLISGSICKVRLHSGSFACVTVESFHRALGRGQSSW